MKNCDVTDFFSLFYLIKFTKLRVNLYKTSKRFFVDKFCKFYECNNEKVIMTVALTKVRQSSHALF